VYKGLTNRLFLTKKFFTFQMNPIDTMEEHLNKLGAIVEELDAIGVPILTKVKVIFMNLFESYQFFVTSPKLIKSINLAKLNCEVIAMKLLNENEKNKLGSFSLRLF
jgi:hypothetical protein